MSNHRLLIDSALEGAHFSGLVNGSANSASMLSRLAQIIESIAGGIHSAKARLSVAMAQAVGTISFSSFVQDDTVTINTVVFTGKDAPSGANQFLTGVSDESSANALTTKINASTLDLIVGCVGASRRGTVLLSSFVNGDTVTVQGYVFTGKTSPADGNQQQFAIGGSDAITAENLMRAIKAFNPTSQLTVTRSSATLTFNFYGTLTLAASAHATVTSKTIVITCLVPGQIGNLCSIAISAHGSVSAATLAGGTEGTMYTFSATRNLVV